MSPIRVEGEGTNFVIKIDKPLRLRTDDGKEAEAISYYPGGRVEIGELGEQEGAIAGVIELVEGESIRVGKYTLTGFNQPVPDKGRKKSKSEE